MLICWCIWRFMNDNRFQDDWFEDILDEAEEEIEIEAIVRIWIYYISVFECMLVQWTVGEHRRSSFKSVNKKMFISIKYSQRLFFFFFFLKFISILTDSNRERLCWTSETWVFLYLAPHFPLANNVVFFCI